MASRCSRVGSGGGLDMVDWDWVGVWSWFRVDGEGQGEMSGWGGVRGWTSLRDREGCVAAKVSGGGRWSLRAAVARSMMQIS